MVRCLSRALLLLVASVVVVDGLAPSRLDVVSGGRFASNTLNDRLSHHSGFNHGELNINLDMCLNLALCCAAAVPRKLPWEM
jgi:hypothetical protein